MWSICGVHDQGFKERPVFGKIRYMVDYSLARKFKVNEYNQKYSSYLGEKDTATFSTDNKKRPTTTPPTDDASGASTSRGRAKKSRVTLLEN